MSEPQPPTQPPTLESALKLHQSGQIAAAATTYRRLLETNPDNPQALHLLGVTFIQSAQPDEAARLIERAVALQPNAAAFHLNLAAAYQALRRIDDTIAEAEKAIALDPSLAARGYQLAGGAFGEAGQLEDAQYCFERAVEADPSSAEAHLMLAISLDRQGRNDEGAVQFDKALALAQQWVAREPENGEAQVLLARIYQQGGNLSEAVATFRAATRLLPGDPKVFYQLGQVLGYQGKRDEALTCFNLALRLSPRYADAHVAVGHCLGRQHRPGEAAKSYRTALELSPRNGEAQGALAAALMACGQSEQAIAAAREAVRISPGDHSVHSTLLLMLHYSPTVTPDELFAEHVEWARRYAEPLRGAIRPHTNFRDPEKVLRVGILSGDFKRHPVAKFILPVLENQDRARFHFACYSDTDVTDDVTESLKKAAAGWRNVITWSDERLARRIREDGIDILVDLSGHTGESRLLTLARKPAPIQVTQFGYPDTTGLSTVDYRITDALSDPPGTTEQWYTEKLARLPRAAYCYRPYEQQPRIEYRKPTEPVVFGSVNNIAKLSAPTLRTWAALLEAAPDARLAVLATSRDLEQTARLLVSHGIDPLRLTVLERAPSAKYLDLFNLFDIALDPFPYNGGVTTCDALWMGVPVITLAGRNYVSRQGVSLLTNVGLADLVVPSPQDYVRIAAELASDRDRLANLRGRLQEMMRTSPLCDYAGYTAELQTFFRQAWGEFCTAP